jgi:beta-ribofuranosylaminobenzene 5'-phosphate synthase
MMDLLPDRLLICKFALSSAAGRYSKNGNAGKAAPTGPSDLASSLPLPTSVTVQAPARLHLGFLNPVPGGGRQFGGIGLAVSEFPTEITIRRSPGQTDIVEGPHAERARRCLQIMRAQLGVGGAYWLRIERAPPSHAGLGSGTQFALAVAAAVRRLEARPLDLQADAPELGRAARSGIGVGVFASGGLIVDGGRGPATRIPPIVARLPVPEPWRLILVLDRARQGQHGVHEAAAFATLGAERTEQLNENCRLVLMAALPALLEGDLSTFAAAIGQLQANIGDYFAPAQGGRFSSPAVASALAALQRLGAAGVGQSSWGPTGFAFVEDQPRATRIIDHVRRDVRFQALEVCLCRGVNCGAQISATPGADT